MGASFGGFAVMAQDASSSVIRWAFLAGLGFAAGEAMVGDRWRGPLDPLPSFGWLLAGAVGLAVAFAGVGALLPRRLGWRRLVVVLVLWAAVWGPAGARAGGLPPWVGWLPAIAAGGPGWWWPRAGVGLGWVGLLWTPVLRVWERGEGGAPLRPPADRPDVMLITVDTVRADAGLLPQAGIDPAAGFRVYESAVAAAPWTLPSMWSVFTGLPVAGHGAGLPVEGGYSGLREGVGSWVPRLREAGYRTVAVVCNPHLRAEQGFADGFQRFVHADDAREPMVLLDQLERWRARAGGVTRASWQREDLLVDAAVAELAAEAEGPLFLWVHLLGPHEYGRAPERGGEGTAAYAGNVAAAAARVRTLVAATPPGAVIVVASDHGEAFGEGGVQGHGQRLDEAELHVPLAVRGPGVVPGVEAGLVGLDGVGTVVTGEEMGVVEGVAVAGVRRDAAAAGVVRAGWVVEEAEAVVPGEAVELGRGVREALERLGYVE